MNRLSRKKRIQVLSAQVEGIGVNACSRMTGIGKPTILRLLKAVGDAASIYQDVALRGLSCTSIEVDEVWGFNYAKSKNLPKHLKGQPGYGSIWTWVALCSSSKLLLSWIMGDRDQRHATALMNDLASRLVCRPQITTDALALYVPAVRDAFVNLGVDYGQIRKIFGPEPDAEHRYSPPVCVACEKIAVTGRPQSDRVSTSFVERSHLTLRMSQRRWTRLTNAHSKKFVNMEAAFSLHTLYYNFARSYQTIKTSPAVAAGVADRVWTMEDIVKLIEEHEAA